jgi:hypothetical protein
MNNSRLIAEALQSGSRASGYNMQHANNYLKKYAPDKRYKLFAVCGVSAWAYNESGKVKYAGHEYEYQQTKAGYIVKPATW